MIHSPKSSFIRCGGWAMSSNRHEFPRATDKQRARRSWSLAARLTAWYTLAALLLILGATGFLYWVLVSNLDREDDQLLANKIHILRRVLRDRPEEVAALAQEVEWQEAGQRPMMILVRVLDGNNRAIMETPGMGRLVPADLFPPPVGIADEPGHGVEVETKSGKAFRIVAAK